MIRNAHWLNQNETRSYPLDDAVTAVDDSGARLPANILTDLNLRWPEHLGACAFLAAAAVTPYAVTLVIQAAETLDSVSDFTPLAALTVPRPVVEGRVYALLPQAVGVGGWVTFGSGANNSDYSGRFSGPLASRFTPRSARGYRNLPVTSLGVLYASPALTGLIRLRATEPLVLSKDAREIRGSLRDCIVLRLSDSAATDGLLVPASSASVAPDSTTVFNRFAGPCAGRPESRTCGDPQPIETINAVAPDCNGLLTVEFQGCATIAQLENRCGVVVDCGLGLIDACVPPKIPSAEGYLPSEYTPANIAPPDEEVPPPSEGVSESYVVLAELPYLDCFESADSVNLTTQSGLFEWIEDDNPTVVCPISVSGVSESMGTSAGSYRSTTAATRNVATWQPPDDVAIFRRVITEAKLEAGPAGAKRNAQVVINHRPHEDFPDRRVYFFAEIDYDTQTIRLGRFTGTTFQTIAPVSVPTLLLETWYRLTLTARATGTDTTLTAHIVSVESNAVDVTLEATVSDYQPSSGAFGVGTNRAITRFGYIQVQEAP